jgi:hypothetical protein
MGGKAGLIGGVVLATSDAGQNRWTGTVVLIVTHDFMSSMSLDPSTSLT